MKQQDEKRKWVLDRKADTWVGCMGRGRKNTKFGG